MKEIKIKSANESILTFNTPNNLPVYMWVNNSKNNVYLTLTVKYGSIGTNFSLNNNNYTVPTGTAHYLEHIKFNTKKGEASELFYDLGCDSNAYTSLRETSYEVYANDNIEEACKLLLDFVYDNYFTKQIVSNERGVILEECNSGKDDPEFEFFRRNMESFLTKSNHRNPVIGYERDINKITIDDVSLIHDFFYRPENMFLTITGNFDPKRLEKIINENEKDRTFKDIGKVKINNPKDTKGFLENHFIIESDKISVTHGKYIIKALESDFKNYTKNEILIALRTYLKTNFGPTSDFYEYIIQNNIATRLTFSVSYDDKVFGLGFDIISDDPDKVFDQISDKLKNMNITKEDINRVIKNYRSASIMRYDNIYSVNNFIVSSIIDNDKVDDSKFDVLKKMTVSKIKEIYKCIDLENKMTSILKPKK